jgi:hypothetical protein
MPTEVAPRFFMDETTLAVGRALALVRGDVLHPGHRRLPEVPLGADDTVWLDAVAARDLVVISRDRHIKTKPAELEAFHNLGIRAFWIAGNRDLGNWENLTRLVRSWDLIEAVVRDRGKGPWFYSINLTNLREIPLRAAPAKRVQRSPTTRAAPSGPRQLKINWQSADRSRTPPVPRSDRS